MKRWNFKDSAKTTVALLLVVSFIVPASFITLIPAKPADAAVTGCTASVISQVVGKGIIGKILGSVVPVGDSTTQLSTGGSFMSDCILKPIAIKMARTMVRNISNSIVNWINNDFEGKPGFVTDIRALAQDSADEVIGNMIYGSDLNFLCSPFAFKVRLALATKYSQPFQEQVRCTLTQVIDNTNRALTWDDWLSVTTVPQNNEFSAFLMADSQLTKNIQTKLDDVNNMLNRNGGFLDFQTCDEYETPLEAQTRAGGGVSNTLSGSNTGNNFADPESWESFTGNTPPSNQLPSFASTKIESATPQCKKMSTKTPGSLVQEQANKVLGGWADQLNLVDSIDQVVGALISHFTDKMISGATGFLGLSGSRGYASSNINYAQAATLSADFNNPENAGLGDVDNAVQTGIASTSETFQVIDTQLLEASGAGTSGATDGTDTNDTADNQTSAGTVNPVGGIETLDIVTTSNSRFSRSSTISLKSFLNTEGNANIATLEVSLSKQGVPTSFNNAMMNGSVGFIQNGVTRAFYPGNSSGITFTNVSVGPSYNTGISLNGISFSDNVGFFSMTITAKDSTGKTLRAGTANFVVE